MKLTSAFTKINKKSLAYKNSRPTLAIVRYAYLATALILLFPIINVGLADLSTGVLSWYAAIVQIGYIMAYALIAPALALLFMGKPLSAWLRGLSNTLMAVMIIAFAWIMVGALQDMVGVQCQGFFGAITACSERQYVSLFIWITYPYVLLSLIGLTLLSAVKGWLDYFYYQDRG